MEQTQKTPKFNFQVDSGAPHIGFQDGKIHFENQQKYVACLYSRFHLFTQQMQEALNEYVNSKTLRDLKDLMHKELLRKIERRVVKELKLPNDVCMNIIEFL